MSFDPLRELSRHVGRHKDCSHHEPFDRKAQSVNEAEYWARIIQKCTPEARREHQRWLARNDLYYLLVHILDIPKMARQWHMDRCREEEALSDAVIDISTRGSHKSARKTFGHIIQEILNDPEVCIGIFSHTRPIAKGFLRALKTTFESHVLLRELFPEIFYVNPAQESPVWSLDFGITVVRKSVTRREATIEAWGVIDGLPSSRHFDILVFDDLQKQRESTEMIMKIEDAFDTALGLGASKPARWWMAGVFYRGGSICENLMDRKVGLARVRPAIDDDGTSPIWSDEEVRATKAQVSPAVWACEYLVDPTKKVEGEGFKEEWLKYHDGADTLGALNYYIIVDPGYGKQQHGKSGKCAIGVIGCRADKKKYLIDGIVAGMTLEQRATWVLAMHRQYQPKRVIYEKFGLQADVENLKNQAKREGYPEFELKEASAPVPKAMRIEWLIVAVKRGDWVFPKSIPIRNINGEDIDFMKYFLDVQYRKYPATKIIDVIDMLAWAEWRDAGLQFPESYDDPSVTRKKGIDWDETEGGSWMSN